MAWSRHGEKRQGGKGKGNQGGKKRATIRIDKRATVRMKAEPMVCSHSVGTTQFSSWWKVAPWDGVGLGGLKEPWSMCGGARWCAKVTTSRHQNSINQHPSSGMAWCGVKSRGFCWLCKNKAQWGIGQDCDDWALTCCRYTGWKPFKFPLVLDGRRALTLH